jgi:hypothetical protein
VAVGAVVVMVGGLTATLKLLTGADALLGWLAVATLLLVGLMVLTVRWWRTRKNSAWSRRKSVAQAGGLLAGFAVLGAAIAFLLSAVVVDSVRGAEGSTTTFRAPGSTTPSTATTSGAATTRTRTRTCACDPGAVRPTGEGAVVPRLHRLRRSAARTAGSRS